MEIFGLLFQLLFLLDTEFVLLVDYHQAEGLKLHAQKRMGPHGDTVGAVLETLGVVLFLLGRRKAVELGDGNVVAPETLQDRVVVLVGKQGGRYDDGERGADA